MSTRALLFLALSLLTGFVAFVLLALILAYTMLRQAGLFS